MTPASEVGGRFLLPMPRGTSGASLEVFPLRATPGLRRKHGSERLETSRSARRFDRVASLSEIPDGGSKRVNVGGHAVGLYRRGTDVFAIDDVCTHEQAYLSEGEFDRDALEVECPLHGSRFCLRTGDVRILPATRPVRRYDVLVEGDDISIALDPVGD